MPTSPHTSTQEIRMKLMQRLRPTPPTIESGLTEDATASIERTILRSLNRELDALQPYLDEQTRLKLQKTINVRLLDMMNEARDAAP